MAFPTYDLTLEQGVTYKMYLSVQDTNSNPIDVTGWTFNGTIKESTDTTLPPVAVLNVTATVPVSGTLFLMLPATEAEKLVRKRYVWDLIGRNPNPTPIEFTRIVQGKVTVDLAVTSLSGS